jgi:type I restriction enzyme S subunit
MHNDLPTGWKRYSLGDVAHINMGQSPASTFYNQQGNGLPLIQGNADCQDRRTLINTYTSQITKRAYVDDIIMSVRAPVGTIAVCSQDSCIGRGVCAIRGKKIDHQYLKHYLIFIEAKWNRLGQGSTFTAINSDDISNYSIVAPEDDHTQQQIARILSTWDSAIERLDRLLAAKRHLKAGLLSSYLRSKKLVGRSFEFGEVAERVTNKYKGPEKNLPCIELEHLSQGTGEILSTFTCSALETKTHFLPGDVLFGKLRPYLRKYAQPDFEGVCSSEIWVLRGKKSVCSNDFLLYLVQSHNFLSLCNKTFGSKMPRADWNLLEENPFDIPPEKDQKLIVSVLHCSDREIKGLSRSRDLLIQQKKGLMQGLLTGKVRVRV